MLSSPPQDRTSHYYIRQVKLLQKQIKTKYNGIKLVLDIQSVTYPLNGVAASAKGTILPPTNGEYGHEVQYRFYDDAGKLLYTSPIMIKSTQPITFEFSTQKALSLKIELTCKTTKRYSWNDCLIEDMTITTTDY